MKELDRFVVANPAKVPCSIRTLRPFNVDGLAPWVHYGEIADAMLYLAARAQLPATEILALKELQERVSCLLRDLSGSPDPHQEGNSENTHAP